MIALDFDSPFVDRASRSAGGFQLRQNGVQVRCDRVEPRDDGHGLAFAAFLSANAGGLALGKKDYARFVAWAGALRQGLFAYLAVDGALQRCSIKEARHWKDYTRLVSLSESKTRWDVTESSGGAAISSLHTPGKQQEDDSENEGHRSLEERPRRWHADNQVNARYQYANRLSAIPS